jgi:hypothetical protein
MHWHDEDTSSAKHIEPAVLIWKGNDITYIHGILHVFFLILSLHRLAVGTNISEEYPASIFRAEEDSTFLQNTVI